MPQQRRRNVLKQLKCGSSTKVTGHTELLLCLAEAKHFFAFGAGDHEVSIESYIFVDWGRVTHLALLEALWLSLIGGSLCFWVNGQA